MATWAYPPLPPERLKQEEESALVGYSLYGPLPIWKDRQLLTASHLIDERARMAAELSPRVFGLFEGGSSGMRRAACSQETGLDSGSLVATV